MPLYRGQWSIGEGISEFEPVVVEAEPSEWPRNPWEVLELHLTEQTGWRWLDGTAHDALLLLYNGAHGQLLEGLAGFIVQYMEGTGSDPFTVTDWRGNSGTFAFVPDTGYEVNEVHGAAEDDPAGAGYRVATIRLVQVSVVYRISSSVEVGS